MAASVKYYGHKAALKWQRLDTKVDSFLWRRVGLGSVTCDAMRRSLQFMFYITFIFHPLHFHLLLRLCLLCAVINIAEELGTKMKFFIFTCSPTLHVAYTDSTPFSSLPTITRHHRKERIPHIETLPISEML